MNMCLKSKFLCSKSWICVRNHEFVFEIMNLCLKSWIFCLKPLCVFAPCLYKWSLWSLGDCQCHLRMWHHHLDDDMTMSNQQPALNHYYNSIYYSRWFPSRRGPGRVRSPAPVQDFRRGPRSQPRNGLSTYS